MAWGRAPARAELALPETPSRLVDQAGKVNPVIVESLTMSSPVSWQRRVPSPSPDGLVPRAQRYDAVTSLAQLESISLLGASARNFR